MTLRLLAVAAGCLGVALSVQATDAPPASFDASFLETRTLPGFAAPLVSHGLLRVDKVNGFHWEITAPYHYVFEMNGKLAHEQLPDGARRDLNPDQTPWLAAVERIFVGALSGDRSSLESYFEVAIQPLAQGQSVTLKPKPGPIANAIVSIQVTESAPGQPQRLEIRETSGGHMDIRFTPIPQTSVAP